MRIFTKQFYLDSFKVLKATITGFNDDKVMKLSASLSYYTIFALAPLLIVVLALVGFFLGDAAVEDKIYPQINGFVGAEAAMFIQTLIQNLSVSDGSLIATVIGVGTLVFASTKVFIEMQDSLNMIFNVKPKPKRGWLKLIIDRGISFSIVIALGLLLITTFFASAFITLLGSSIGGYLPDWKIFGFDLFDQTTVVVLSLANAFLSFIVLSVLFGAIFKFLPDIKIKWADVRSGAFFTAILFMIGKWGIGLYMQYSAPASAYGAAGSVIIIILWIYYIATILFLGAEFTEKNAKIFGTDIKPSSSAVQVEETEKVVAVGEEDDKPIS